MYLYYNSYSPMFWYETFLPYLIAYLLNTSSLFYPMFSAFPKVYYHAKFFIIFHCSNLVFHFLYCYCFSISISVFLFLYSVLVFLFFKTFKFLIVFSVCFHFFLIQVISYWIFIFFIVLILCAWYSPYLLSVL